MIFLSYVRGYNRKQLCKIQNQKNDVRRQTRFRLKEICLQTSIQNYQCAVKLLQGTII